VTGRMLKAPNLLSMDFANREGARLATEHLIGLGHRRIAFIAGDPAHADAVEREQGYRQALEAARLRVDPALVLSGAFTEHSGLAAVERLLDSRSRFSAIFAANDQMAFGAMLGLYRRGRRVPDDVSVVGFDDLASSLFMLPPLTTVHNPVQEIGELSARAILSLIGGQRPSVEVPGPRLIVRESTRAAA
jgi:LacI family transcriptional regulator